MQSCTVDESCVDSHFEGFLVSLVRRNSLHASEIGRRNFVTDCLLLVRSAELLLMVFHQFFNSYNDSYFIFGVPDEHVIETCS